MSYGVFLLRYVDGDVAPLDAERFRQVTGPYALGREQGDEFSQLRVADGGEADLYHATQDGELRCVAASRFARGAMTGVLARLAADLGAAIVPQDGGVLIFHEDERRHLPAELRGGAVVIAPTGEALQAAFDER
ncbi:hypothetical protein [Streptomyces indicus]|uniref:Uncharacterized protein n=1 Tax=Streptomyces indicus TaxID=417292 RepID=A0A1G9GVH4_9ACTN|nr:hypothetical protein [Streptomyces indicus]SDL04283.1 hypothetical protein SAMN05421806_11721 [Streptomyces indicus]